MTTELNQYPPVPVIPLNYFEQHREPWLPMILMIARLVMAFQVCTIIGYALSLAGFAWQELGPRYRVQYIPGIPLLVDLPFMIIDLFMLKAAIDTARLLEKGRRMLLLTAMAKLILYPPREIGISIYYHYTRQHWLSGPSYVYTMFAAYLLTAVECTIFPLFLRRFFKRPEVQTVFANADAS
jgi:hypothetical protein